MSTTNDHINKTITSVDVPMSNNNQLSNSANEWRSEIHGALARGYCSEKTSHRELDAELVKEMAIEVEKLFNQHTAQIVERYNELLLAVEKKHTGETRHETALRYIKDAEKTPDQVIALVKTTI